MFPPKKIDPFPFRKIWNMSRKFAPPPKKNPVSAPALQQGDMNYLSNLTSFDATGDAHCRHRTLNYPLP